MKMTKHRKNIMNAFDTNPDKVLSIDDIAALLKADAVDLSTIYRNIHVLIDAQYINKCVMKGVPYYYLNREGHHHLAVCTECHNFYEINCVLDTIIKATAISDKMKITGHDLMLFGVCTNCQ